MHTAQTELGPIIVGTRNNYRYQSNVSSNPIKACLHSDAAVSFATIY